MLNDLAALAGQIVQPANFMSSYTTSCSSSSLENEIQMLAQCVASNNYINFISILNNTLLVLEPLMNADCNNVTALQQCEQEYANSIFS